MASTSPGYGITIRVEGHPDTHPVAAITSVMRGAGAPHSMWLSHFLSVL